MNDKKEGGNEIPAIPVAENLFAAEVYADDASFFSIKNGNVSIAFSSLRFDNSSDPGVMKRVIIGRLVIPVANAQALAIGLYDFLKKQGFDVVQSKTFAN
jgi:hypothetical protein